MRRFVLLAAGAAVSVLSLWWLFHRVDVAAIANHVRQLSPWVWVAGAAIYLCGFWPRAFRWRLMLSPVAKVPPATLGRSIILGYAGNNLLPFRLGEVIRAIAFERLSGVPAATGLASVVVERLFDGITIVLVFLVAVMVSQQDLLGAFSMRPILWGAAILTVLGLVGLIAAIRFGDAFAEKVGRYLPKLVPLLIRVNEGLRFLRTPRILFGVLATSCLIWAIEGGMFVLFAWALGVSSPCLAGYLALAVVNLGVLIPSAPGYIGVFQVASVLAFGVLGNDQSKGLAFGVLVHSAQFIPVTVIGLVMAAPLWADLRREVKSHD